jgi:serine/threonine protein kinase
MATWRNQSQTITAAATIITTTTTEETPRNYSEALRFASQMASAVSHLHARKIINRDLKPENVGIDGFGNVQLFDFGFCRSLPPPQSQSQSQSEKKDGDDENETFLMTGRIGTLRYMAPEVALREPYNLKADVYSWSVILWEMLSLQHAYKDVPLDEFLTCICRQGRRHDLNPGWPRPIRDLIHRIWVNPVSKRPTMQQVFCELRDIQKLSEFHEINKQTIPILLETSTALEMEKREPLTVTKIASTPEQNGSNRGSRIVTHEDPAHQPTDEKDKVSLRDSKHDLTAPIARGGRSTNVASRTFDNSSLDSEHPVHEPMDKRDENSWRDSKHDTAVSHTIVKTDPASPSGDNIARDRNIELARGDSSHYARDENDKVSFKGAKHDLTEPIAMGGRSTDITSPTLDNSSRDGSIVPNFARDTTVNDTLRNPQHGMPAPAVASPTTFFSLSELISGVDGIPYNLREQHLHPDEFEKLFGMTREKFNEMREWKRVDAKKKVGLF